MERPWSATAPYRRGSDGHPRPYLWLTLKGPRGGPDVPIVGLVDTGADKSVLPVDYAQLLGYQAEDLAPVEVGQVEGSASAWDAQKPCEAFVNGVHPSSLRFNRCSSPHSTLSGDAPIS